MGKVNLCIKYCLINKNLEYNIKGILCGEKIKYQDDDAKMIVDKNNNTLERIKESESYMFDFKNNICIMTTKEMKFSFPIKVLEYKIEKNIFHVKYQIDNNIYEYKINILEEL